jgi:hypothetical protein
MNQPNYKIETTSSSAIKNQFGQALIPDIRVPVIYCWSKMSTLFVANQNAQNKQFCKIQLILLRPINMHLLNEK